MHGDFTESPQDGRGVVVGAGVVEEVVVGMGVVVDEVGPAVVVVRGKVVELVSVMAGISF